jgi:RNA polymerase sigma factor (sigma-70 family)
VLTVRAAQMRTEREEPALQPNVYRRLLGTVRRRLGSQDAEDVVQDAYLRLVAARDGSSIRNSDAFLQTVTQNLVRDRGRAAAVRAAVSGDAEREVRCPQPDVVRVISSREQLAVLEQALAELPPKRRAALVLRRFDGMSHAAIADTLGLSVSMVEKHIRIALDHCRHRLAEANGERR